MLFNLEKIAINELSDAIFKFKIAFTVEKLHRFFMFHLACKTLYVTPVKKLSSLTMLIQSKATPKRIELQKRA